MNEKIEKLISGLASYERLRFFKFSKSESEESESEKEEERKKGIPTLEGISFRFKTVQFHIIDDCFEEIKKKPEVFGDVKILSERFSLPGWSRETEDLKKDEYQFEIIAKVDAKVDRDTYRKKLNDVLDKISNKHNVEVLVEGDSEYYNVNKITFHTSAEGVFEKN